MPDYQVINLSLRDFGFMSLLRSGELSLTLKVGVIVEYSLFFGTELHDSNINIFYPNWDGELQYVADLRIIDNSDRNENNNKNNYFYDNNNDIQISGRKRNVDFYDIMNDTRLPLVEFVSREEEHFKNKTSATPYVNFPARQTTYKHDNLVSVQNVLPSTYLHGLKNFFYTRGSIIVGSTAVLHTKTSNVPLTVELICDHIIYFFPFPIRITNQNCALESVTGGWSDLKTRGDNLRRGVEKKFSKGNFLKNHDLQLNSIGKNNIK